jgi:glycosyltransferase involved in cell wall biosynthesis
MRILFISTFGDTRGAAIAAGRMRKALINTGHSVDLLILYGNEGKDTFLFTHGWIDFLKYKWRQLLEKSKFCFYEKTDKSYLFPVDNIGYTNFEKQINNRYDIIHLHWINSFVDIKSLTKLSELSDHLVWTLHDAWPITGGCHVILNCARFTQGCGFCPQLLSSRLSDITRKSLKNKIDEFLKISNIAFTVPSSWMLKQFQNQKLLNSKPVYLIPNTIDTSVFCKKEINPSEKHNSSKKFIGYYSCGKIKYKGLNYFLEIINRLYREKDDLYEYEVIMIGSDYRIDEIPFKTKYLGELKTEDELSEFYNSCNVFISASEEESFGQTALESLLCGTPVVAFENTGIRDFLIHKKNGYLAKYLDTEDLYTGLVFVLSNPPAFDPSEIGNVFKYETVSLQLINFYKTLIKVN